MQILQRLEMELSNPGRKSVIKCNQAAVLQKNMLNCRKIQQLSTFWVGLFKKTVAANRGIEPLFPP